MSRLTEVGRKAERLANRRRRFVDIELLSVSGPALKVGPRRSTSDQAFATDDADVLAVCEDVEEGCFASTGRSHEGRELAGANVAVDVIEELALTARDRNRVAVETDERT